MSIMKEPLSVQCWRCQINFIVKYVPPRKDYSQQNKWNYWIEDENPPIQYICNTCIKHLYYKEVMGFTMKLSKPKRHLLSTYLSEGRI